MIHHTRPDKSAISDRPELIGPEQEGRVCCRARDKARRNKFPTLDKQKFGL